MPERLDPLVSVAWLRENIASPDIRIVDATWYLPTDGRDADEDHEAERLPGAVRMDITDVSDHSNPAPHMLPAAVQFGQAVGALGIANTDRVIVYDRGEYAAARVWWMFRIFGHDRVALLDGGLSAWKAVGGAVETGRATPDPVYFATRLRPELVRTMSEMRKLVSRGGATIIDARPAVRFAGELPEIRPGVQSGHMPGAINLPYPELKDPDTGLYRPLNELRAALENAGVDLTSDLVATCGSGVSACEIALTLERLGVEDVPVYDGSWMEWGRYDDTPKISGRK